MILRSPFKALPLLPSRNRCFDDELLPCHRRRRRRRCLEFRAQFPLEDLLPLLVPAAAIGFASITAFLSSSHRFRKGDSEPEVDGGAAVGDWILFTSPTPFNRCVLLRCPSVSFEDGGELLDGVNDRLLREERHYVNLSRGTIPRKRKKDGNVGDEISYQRVCVRTEDGGVLSLDWPENLDLGKEHGLDTTVLIVPGTTEGSMDRHVRMFVYDALKHGYFPIVMNPRGCAGSPLTTARLFTAADSDDISTAIQHVKSARPWTTLMSISWGYGANMLTKYLAEAGETTPLTAAVCIDNPFDLEEATRSFPHHIAMDQKLTGGLVDILRANKELFHGKAKAFDVAKALSATSLRDFDTAVSMVSYGFEAVEDFYTQSSTRELVSSIKIPVLFIQSDDGTVPLFSIPRSLIAENPFTSLLLCSCLPSIIITSQSSSTLWCQHLAIEWLSGIEFALLKGRHPLVKDVDVTINPSKGVAFVQSTASEHGFTTEKKIHRNYNLPHLFFSKNEGTFFKLSQSNNVNGFLVNPNTNALQRSDDATQKNVNDAVKQNIVVNSAEDGEADILDSEQSEVLQSAAVVMNMLDVTMPGTLDNEQKKKVLTAMEQGETLMKALQEAVPEDVRGKLTTAVGDILQNRSANVNFDELRRLGWIPKLKSVVKSNIQAKIREVSNDEGSQSDTHSTEHYKGDMGGGGESPDLSDIHPESSSYRVSGEPFQEKNLPVSEFVGDGSELGGKPNQRHKDEKSSGLLDEAVGEQLKVNQSDGVADRNSGDQMVVNEANDVHNTDSKGVDSVAEQSWQNSSINSEGASTSASSISDQQITDEKANETKKSEGSVFQDVSDQTAQNSSAKLEEPSPQQLSPKTPSINVAQALDALTGLDDSTQMAVNNVFGVLEDMIDHLEKATNAGSDDETDETENQQSVSESNDSSDSSNRPNNVKDGNDVLRVDSDVEQSPMEIEDSIQTDDSDSKGKLEKKYGDNTVGYAPTSSLRSSASQSQEDSADVNPLGKKIIDNVGHVSYFPMGAAINPYWASPYEAYLHMYHSTQLPPTESPDRDSTTDLFLDSEAGQWKMLDQSKEPDGGSGENHYANGQTQSMYSLTQASAGEEVIEPSYIILDTEYSVQNPSSADLKGTEHMNLVRAKREELISLIRNDLLEALKVEVGRRYGMLVSEEKEHNLMTELEKIVDVVSEEIVCNSNLDLDLLEESNGLASKKLGVMEGEFITRIISSAVQDASHLRKVLPVGVIVGSSLASLRKYFQVATLHDGGQTERWIDTKHEVGQEGQNGIKRKPSVVVDDQLSDLDNSSHQASDRKAKVNLNNKSIMAGAVTAALGASALVVQHQNESNKKGLLQYGHDKLEKSEQETNQSNFVSSLAEKAMSVAGPVVPTTSDGEVDQERLVAILAELGQKGGILRLVGKLALLWGGIRGAMSLTDRLISFLHIAERPLFQRVFGFLSMALVLWSPVVIPLLPALVQSWTIKAPNRIAEYACVVGLHVSITILVMLWGKRIRGYDNPVERYGLDFISPSRVHNFFKGLIGGTLIVLFVHSINAFLGYTSFYWPSNLPSTSTRAMPLLKAYGNMLILVIRGTVTAVGIAIVEELLFRSWLAEEVAVDFGYYQAIMISGVAFSLVQRSLHSVPGYFLLSLALFGMKQRTHGNLAASIGMRAGIMTSNYFLQHGGFLSYRHDVPMWLISTHPMHPFTGAVGLGFSAMLACLFFPWPLRKSPSRVDGI